MLLDTLRNEQENYVKTLQDKEMSGNTIRKYTLAIRNFIEFVELNEQSKEVCKDSLIRFKIYLQQKYKPTTSNLYIVALNSYLRYLDSADLRIKSLKIQTQNILENCFEMDEYKKLLEIAKNQKNDMIYYIIRTLANTGMRVSCLKIITVETIKKGSVIAENKGKTRCFVIPNGICHELINFCEARGITEGYVFQGKNPTKPISQNTVRRWLKDVAILAGIDEEKAFPHNLRHLFAKTFLDKYGNLSELADILGHTRIETTRIYTRTSIEEKRRKMEDIGL